MAHTSSPLRTDRLIWWTRLLQALFVIIVLGLTGTWSTQWTKMGCSPLTKVAFNVACATLTFLLLLLFLIPTTGPLSKTSLWNRWVQITLDAIFLALSIAAAAASQENCGDLCTACHYPQVDIMGWVSWEGLYCKCFPTGQAAPCEPSLANRQSPATPLVGRASIRTWRGSETSATLKNLTKASEMSVKKGLDAGLVLLFALTLFYGLYMIFHKPNPATGNLEMTGEQHENMTKMGQTVTETAVPGP